MSINLKISDLWSIFNKTSDLGGLFLNYVLNNRESLIDDMESILNSYSGNLENSAAHGYLAISLEQSKFDEIFGQLNNKTIKKSISVFHIIGICLLFKGQNDYRYQAILKDWFENHSIRVKFLISRIFVEYNDLFQSDLRTLSNDNGELSILKDTYIKDSNLTMEYNNSDFPDDVIHLLILLEYKQKKKYHYQGEKEELLESIFYATREIQSKHKVFNNNEDQFNSVLHSMLSMNYIVENQSQRGLSTTETTFGELDVSVFTKINKYPLAIIEAFVISSIDKSYISKHLNKLTVNYDPNGLSRNFAVIYVKANNFQNTWNRYLKFLSDFEYSSEIKEMTITDDSSNHPTFTNIRIGISTLIRNKLPIEVYHIFLDMKK